MSKLSFGSHSQLALAGTAALLASVAGCSGDEGGPDTMMGMSGANPYTPGQMVDINGDNEYEIAVDTDGDGIVDGFDADGDGDADYDLDGNPIDQDDGKPSDSCRPFCDDGRDDTNGCGDLNYELAPTKTNVMVLVDGSSSMETNWSTVRDGLVKIVNANPSINFGIHMFYAETADLGEFVNGLNACGAVQHPRLEVAAKNGQNIVNAMGPRPPGPGNQFIDTSPVLAGLNYYLQNDSPLTDPETTNYLVIISDLVDTCFGTFFSNPDSVSEMAGSEQLLAFEKLAVELRKKHIRVLPIGFDPNPQNGSMAGATGAVNVEALEALTKLGGTSVAEPLVATNATDLNTAIDALGVAVQPCRFKIPAVVEEGLNAFKLSFFINKKIVVRDRTNSEGWNFVEGNTQEVEFYGAACRAIQTGNELEARLGCGDDDVCGVASTKLTTRARALHILLDGSASMWGNPFDPFFSGELTPWGQATKALAGMVTDPINDDLEFGFQFFPAGANDQCDIDVPEVAIGSSTEISVIETMVGKIPTGGTPLVGALQSVADEPGRLIDKDVVGAVLLVSDGAHSGTCPASDMPAADLATASKALADQGVRTYAVRFGESTDNEQIEQLSSIAINGGTQSYLDAPDQDTLTMVFKQISDELASCELRLGQLPNDVDPMKVNIFLNGTQVPRDDSGKQKNGWFWTSDTSKKDYSKLEFFGEHCTLLKNSRLSDIVIEFGCEPIVIK